METLSAPAPDVVGHQKTPRLDSLTSLRAFAALAVFCTHLNGFLPAFHRGSRLMLQGAAGVSFFFILSGFVLAWSSRPGASTWQFYRRRAARIVPAYWVACLLSFPVIVLEGGNVAARLRLALPQFTLLQTWWPDETLNFGGNGVGWSLSVELFFYLLFPLVIVAARRLTAAAQMAAVVVLVAVEYAWDLGWWSHTQQPLEGWLLGGFPPVRLLEFSVGVLLALLVRDGRLRGVALWWALPFAAAGYVADGFAPAGLTTVPFPVVPFAVLIVAAANSDLRGSASWLRARWLVKLGEWSFAFYLLHQMVLRVLAVTTLGGHPAGVAFAVEALLVATVLSAALFTFVERPLDRWLRGDGTLPVTEQ